MPGYRWPGRENGGSCCCHSSIRRTRPRDWDDRRVHHLGGCLLVVRQSSFEMRGLYETCLFVGRGRWVPLMSVAFDGDFMPWECLGSNAKKWDEDPSNISRPRVRRKATAPNATIFRGIFATYARHAPRYRHAHWIPWHPISTQSFFARPSIQRGFRGRRPRIAAADNTLEASRFSDFNLFLTNSARVAGNQTPMPRTNPTVSHSMGADGITGPRPCGRDPSQMVQAIPPLTSPAASLA